MAEALANSFSSLDTGERCQVTALSYDLVGSVRLSAKLDPEDMREVLHSFHAACTRAIEAHGGRVSNYTGDGGMAYFGFPRAHEDEPERAIRAGIAIVNNCRDLVCPGDDAGLCVRVGIATGIVVVGGERSFDRGQVVGVAPNLAFRLQTIADPNSVLVSEATHRLAGRLFRWRSQRFVTLAGFEQKQLAWPVAGTRRTETRFQAHRGSTITPLIFRDRELREIIQRWQAACSGEGQVILLSGEAGIGKSRLAATARAILDDEIKYYLNFQCSSQHADTPLHPIIIQLERALILRPGHPQLTRSRLLNLLSEPVPAMPEAAPLFAHLLSLPKEIVLFPLEVTSEQVKERTLEALIQFVAGLSARGPVFILIEDVQWIDPTSRELLDIFVERICSLRVLALLTLRPDPLFAAPVLKPHVTLLEVGRLDEHQSEVLVISTAGPSTLSKDQIIKLVTRADGVPFFLEELTKAAIEADRKLSLGPGEVAKAEIPGLLLDLLTARLDQTGNGKLVAQVASAIGRSFSYGLLRSVSKLDEESLAQSLTNLINFGLMNVTGRVPNAEFSFRHALLQEWAYQSMLRLQRQSVHRTIAEVLESEFAGLRAAAPEVLAHHFTEACLVPRAVEMLHLAGRTAASRSANVEAVRLLRKGLNQLALMPEDAARHQTELQIILTLAPILITTIGPGAAEVQSLYARAIEVCSQLPPSPLHFAAHWGWWRTSPNNKVRRGRANLLSEVAIGLRDRTLELQAHHCQWATQFMVGEQTDCCAHIELGLLLYDADDRHRSDTIMYGGHDTKVCALANKAHALWLLGRPKQSLAALKACESYASKLNHVGSTAHFREAVLNLLYYRRDVHTVIEEAKMTANFAEEVGFRDLGAKAEIFTGWGLAVLGDPATGLRELERGLTKLHSIGTQEDFPAYYEMLAEACGLSHEYDRGRATIDQAIDLANDTGSKYWSAELFRRKGELLLALGQDREGETCFDEAISIAQSQNTLSLLLRASTSKAGLLARAGRGGDARNILESLLNRLTGHVGTADHRAASVLLHRLG
jgi:class 3 adenylate cyclase/predicted ATPase